MRFVAQLQAKNNRLAVAPYLLLIVIPEIIPTTGPVHTPLIQSRIAKFEKYSLHLELNF